MQQPTIINGVNVDDLTIAMEAIKENPAIASFQFRAENKWVQGGMNQTTISDFYGACEPQKHKTTFVFKADEPPVLLSTDEGANPVEYALTALAACVTTALVYHAAARGIRLDCVESTLEGDIDIHGLLGMDENVRRGYEGVRMTFRMKGDMPEEEMMDVLRLGPTFSPVFDIFTNKVPVTVMMEHNNQTMMVMQG
jgi:uncharacterized OsmC-like protein